jgi:hypothetical protein
MQTDQKVTCVVTAVLAESNLEETVPPKTLTMAMTKHATRMSRMMYSVAVAPLSLQCSDRFVLDDKVFMTISNS